MRRLTLSFIAMYREWGIIQSGGHSQGFGLKGFIQNLPDGRVKIAAEGDKESLERFVKTINIDNALNGVD
ncbi:MAG: acylphosphatase [Halobacteriota archaeon]